MKKEASKSRIKVFALCFIFVIIVSLAGSLFTSNSVNSDWYNSIKPEITPPNFVFPIAWTILYILLALSMYYAWINAKERRQKIKISFAFGINLIFNATWSMVFFASQNALAGFFNIIVLWLSIILCMVIVRKISKASFYLLIPYLLWVSFAAVLNFFSIK